MPLTAALAKTATTPLTSLQRGQWIKLICGASYQHLPVIRDLALVYTLAGVDCIDMAADAAVVSAVRRGVEAALSLTDTVPNGFHHRPWLMVSLNDGVDPHFRKAVLRPETCATNCSQPCVSVCPTAAVEPVLGQRPVEIFAERCYGCGRCLPICPAGVIVSESRQVGVDAIATQLLPHIDAIEIHTQPGRQSEFDQLWRVLAPAAIKLKLVAVSCPDGPNHLSYLRQIYEILRSSPTELLWQTDGRPMSGDIGAGTTHAAVRLAQTVLNAGLPGYVQLAGGTNAHTVTLLKRQGLLSLTSRIEDTAAAVVPSETRTVAGVAYGSYARRLVLDYLTETGSIEANVDRLTQAVQCAQSLVDPIRQGGDSGPDVLR
ncbi:MAG: LdpA C-terminal domain-containing domain [Cyanobacteria bacterium J06632_22]